MKMLDAEFLVKEVRRLDLEIDETAKSQFISSDLLINDSYGYALRVYVLLTYLIPLINFDDPTDDVNIFYNRYLWFYRFAKYKENREGYDPGINQQILSILEEANNDGLDVDWSVVQSISEKTDAEILS